MEPTYRTYEVYALEGVCDKLVGEKSTGTDKDATAFKTAAELKSDAMLTTLGDAFKKDAGNVNNGYPFWCGRFPKPAPTTPPARLSVKMKFPPPAPRMAPTTR